MNHLIVTKVKILVNHDVSNINLGNRFEGSVPFKSYFTKQILRVGFIVLPFPFWPPKLMLVFNVNNILDGRLCVNPELVVSPFNNSFNNCSS